MTQSPAGDDHGGTRRGWAIAATAVAVVLIVGGIWWSSRSGDDDAPASPTTPAATADSPGEPSESDEPSDTPDPAGAEILISDPADGAEVGTTFTVTGKAAAFEATVEWELSKDGSVVKEGFTTAEECCTLSPYSFEVTAEPGDYTLTVRNTDPSDGEGKPPAEASVAISVR